MHHDLFALLAERRSVKRFSPQPVEMDKLLQTVQAATLAPSSGNIQNWSFIVVSDVQTIRDMYPLTLEQEPFLSAMAAVVVCGDVEHAHQLYGMRGKRLYTIQNCAAAIQNMLLAAHALGLGTIWIGAFDEDKVSGMLSIPNHRHRPQAIILFGYPDVESQEKELKPLENVVYFNKYGNKVLRPHLVYYDWVTEWREQAKKFKLHLAQKKHVSQQATSVPKKEYMPSPEHMKRRLRDMIDNLKKEQYRKK
jgi:nitroreductase